MQLSTFQGKGGMINAGEYLPGKGRHGKCRVVPSREREVGMTSCAVLLISKHGWLEV